MRGDGGIYKRAGTKSWWIQYTRGGKRVQISAQTESKTTALAKLKKLTRLPDNEFLSLQNDRRVTVRRSLTR